MEYNCPYCKKIIVKDLRQYLKKYKNEKWMMCPYCYSHIEIGQVKESVK